MHHEPRVLAANVTDAFLLHAVVCVQGSGQTNMLIMSLPRWALPGAWAYAASITANNYLQAQKVVRPQVVTNAVVLVIHPLLNWLCIYTLGMPCIVATAPCKALHDKRDFIYLSFLPSEQLIITL